MPAFGKANAEAIVLVARNGSALEAICSEISKINPNAQLLAVPTNIGEEESVKALFEKIKRQFGAVNVLVNAAGVLGAENIPLKDGAFSEWWNNFVRPPIFPSSDAPPKSSRSGCEREGHSANVQVLLANFGNEQARRH